MSLTEVMSVLLAMLFITGGWATEEVGVVGEMIKCLDHVPPSLGKYPFFLDKHEKNARNFCGCVRKELKQVVSFLGDMKYFYPEINYELPLPDTTKDTTEAYIRVSQAVSPLREADLAKTFVQNCVNKNKKFNQKGVALIYPSDSVTIRSHNRMYGFVYNLVAESSLGGGLPNSGHWYQAVTANSYVSDSLSKQMAIGAAFCHPPGDIIGTAVSLGIQLS